MGKQKHRRLLTSRDIWGWLFMLPFVLSLFVFGILPMIVSVGLSLFSYDLYQTPVFVGLGNFRSLLLEDAEFTLALKNTLVYAFTVTPITFFLNFFLAWTLNSLRPGLRNVMVMLFYIPQMSAGGALTIVWMYLFSGDRYGLINHFLTTMGWITQPIQWLTDTDILFYVVMFIGVMMGSGMTFLTFVSGFQALPADVYEAGRIDGVRGRFRELIYLTAPQMKPQMLYGAGTASVGAFAVADIPAAVAGFPSPGYAAHTIALHMRDYGFIRFEVGYASAISVVLFLLTFGTGWLLRKVLATHDG